MRRYYFDVQDSTGFHRDEMPDGEVYTVICEVRDEMDRVVYRGRLTYEGLRL